MEKVKLEVGLKFKSNYRPGQILEIKEVDKNFVKVFITKEKAKWFDKLHIVNVEKHFADKICHVLELPKNPDSYRDEAKIEVEKPKAKDTSNECMVTTDECFVVDKSTIANKKIIELEEPKVEEHINKENNASQKVVVVEKENRYLVVFNNETKEYQTAESTKTDEEIDSMNKFKVFSEYTTKEEALNKKNELNNIKEETH